MLLSPLRTMKRLYDMTIKDELLVLLRTLYRELPMHNQFITMLTSEVVYKDPFDIDLLTLNGLSLVEVLFKITMKSNLVLREYGTFQVSMNMLEIYSVYNSKFVAH